jgi:hypothetical protein
MVGEEGSHLLHGRREVDSAAAPLPNVAALDDSGSRESILVVEGNSHHLFEGWFSECSLVVDCHDRIHSDTWEEVEVDHAARMWRE